MFGFLSGSFWLGVLCLWFFDCLFACLLACFSSRTWDHLGLPMSFWQMCFKLPRRRCMWMTALWQWTVWRVMCGRWPSSFWPGPCSSRFAATEATEGRHCVWPGVWNLRFRSENVGAESNTIPETNSSHLKMECKYWLDTVDAWSRLPSCSSLWLCYL